MQKTGTISQLQQRKTTTWQNVFPHGMDPPSLGPAGRCEKTRLCQAAATGDREGNLSIRRCCGNEIARLRRSEVRDDALVLANAKTETRKVPLNVRTRRILDGWPWRESPFVFPSPHNPSRPLGHHFSLWYRVRRKAGIGERTAFGMS